MNDKRQNMIYLFVGRIGSGKTDDMKNAAQKIYASNPSITKMVVFDEFDNDVWHTMATWNHPERSAIHLPIVTEEQVLRLKSGQVRLIQDNKPPVHYFELFRRFRNTVIVVEDITRMIEAQDRFPDALASLIFDVKQKNLELLIACHSLMEVHAKLARHCRIVVLHHTEEPEVPKKFPSPKLHQAFSQLKKVDPDSDPFARIAVPINVPNLK